MYSWMGHFDTNENAQYFAICVIVLNKYEIIAYFVQLCTEICYNGT